MPAPMQVPPLPAGGAESIENRYYAYLREQGYSTTQALLDVLRVYVPLFDGLPAVADLGCGHGEFLEMLRAQGHSVSGVDIDPGMIEECRSQGFDAELGDAEAWLDARPLSLDGVFSSNVVEHLPAQTVTNWIAASYRALRPGGKLVLTTPNPESAIVQLYEFWRDPTHVRLYSRQLLEFMLVDAGFVTVTSHENPAAVWEGSAAMMTGIDDALPEPPPFAPPAHSEPAATPPAAGAPLRQRLAWSLSSFVYRTLTAPYLEPVRIDVERQLLALQQQAQALQAERAALEELRTRIRRLAAANSFLHPSREIYVVGVKPASHAA